MASAAGNLLALTDDNLTEILIRLPTLEDFGRACVACPTFRRVITSHSFRRRLPALHTPSFLGIVSNVFVPSEPPHPYVAAAAGNLAAVDFSCSFLPSRDRWRRRDGRVLFSAGPEDSSEDHGDPGAMEISASDLAVCDPIHRRYLLLPAIPDDLVSLVDQQEIVEFEPFLAPATDEDEGSSSFKVICLAQSTSRMRVFEFSSGSGQWHASEFQGWEALTAETDNPDPGYQSELSTRYYANGSFCWVMPWIQKLLKLDPRTMGFYSMDIPPGHPMTQRAIVEAGERRFGYFTLHLDMIQTKSNGLMSCSRLFYTVLPNGYKGANELEPSEVIVLPLPLKHRFNIMGVARDHLLVQGIPENMYSLPVSERPALNCFSVNLKTLQLEWFCETKHPMLLAQMYVGFPLNLSPPTILDGKRALNLSIYYAFIRT
ncbi:hypothetical protein PR202_gb21211 [Eleusine coracana subsp. coracana]|uniref:F-box domain-containing protein n=1 Tax=Eleusine coracana subsp. coracana TaxID=191504 RepID=A0AAV5FD18_ELECO|nr:hypothetical protein QOZ80_7BG0603550 [Eleusine coracana subsp. coracana]GJN32689.1 hypothetical protein PR202_gb21211 [Eleusine coracana subsp. coracana]